MSTSTTVHEAEAKTTCLQETKPCCGALHPQLGVLDGVGRRGRGKTHVVDPGDCLGALFLPPHDRWTKAKLGALSFGSRGQGETLCFLKNCICSGTLGTGAGVSVPGWVLSSQRSGGTQGVAGAEQHGNSGLPGQGAKASAPLLQIPLALTNPSGDLQKRARRLLRHKDTL